MEGTVERVRAVLSEGLDADASDVDRVAGATRISGFVISAAFAGKDALERQQMVWRLLRQHLSEDELLDLGLMFTLTPVEAAAVAEG